MAEDFIQAQYDITKKSKLRKFYDSNKILIISSVLILIILIGSFSFYLQNKEKKRILLSENYVRAKIYLANGNKSEALSVLKKVIFANDQIYSTLCFSSILTNASAPFK